MTTAGVLALPKPERDVEGTSRTRTAAGVLALLKPAAGPKETPRMGLERAANARRRKPADQKGQR